MSVTQAASSTAPAECGEPEVCGHPPPRVSHRPADRQTSWSWALKSPASDADTAKVMVVRAASERLWKPADDAWRRLAESVDDVAIIILDHAGTIVSWTRGAESLKGYTSEEAIGRSFSMFYPQEAVDVHHPQRELSAAASIGRYEEEGWRVRKDGTRFWAHVVITALHNADGEVEGFGKMTRDLTPVKQAEEQRLRAFQLLEATAATDSLTGLANRRAWDETVDDELERAAGDRSPLCIAVLDLDHFKAYNDEHGHRQGDHFLRRCSVVWKTKLRASDLLARYGGEEFALCLPRCTPEEAREVVDRLRGSTPNDQTCSAGVAEWDGEERADELFGRADTSLYQAKENGRNQTVFAQSSRPRRFGPVSVAG